MLGTISCSLCKQAIILWTWCHLLTSTFLHWAECYSDLELRQCGGYCEVGEVTNIHVKIQVDSEDADYKPPISIFLIILIIDDLHISAVCVLSTTRVAHLLCCVVSGHAQLNHDPAWNFQLSFTYGRGIMKCGMANWFYSLHLKCSLCELDCVPRPVQCRYLLSQTKKIQILQINTAKQT